MEDRDTVPVTTSHHIRALLLAPGPAYLGEAGSSCLRCLLAASLDSWQPLFASVPA